MCHPLRHRHVRAATLAAPLTLALTFVLTFVLTLAAPGAAAAQDSTTAAAGGGRDRARPEPLFEAETPLAVALTANFERLRRDKADEAPWRTGTLAYAGEGGDSVRIPLRLRTRGNWRLKNCGFPPIRLDFWSDSSRRTHFRRLDEPKLVNFCHDNGTHEEYVLQEFQLYRIYQLLTPFSHQVRLLRMTYVDSGSNRVRTTRWAFLVEQPKSMAERLEAVEIEQRGAGPGFIEPMPHVLYAVFQYMIGNTDWSVAGLHNTELLSHNGRAIPVAFDFDYAGAVSTSYAVPDPSVGIRTVRERRYRGYCVGDEHFPAVFALFNAQKDSIYALYRDEIGRLMDARTVERTLRYFDEFYEIINDSRRAQREIVGECRQ